MKIFLLTILGFLCVQGISQIRFEKAYFIDNNGLKTSGLIKNMDWVYNPFSFEYKISENDVPLIMDISSVAEFGIYDFSRYVRVKVNIDRSGSELKQTGNSSESSIPAENLFLKVLIDGPARLYYFQDANNTLFFYSINNSAVEQLLYGLFNINGQYQLVPAFRQQLWRNLKCEGISQIMVENLDYRKDELVKFFREYYKCTGDPYLEYKKIVKRDYFNVKISPGVTNSSFSIYHTHDQNGSLVKDWEVDFENQLNFRFGLEFEYIFPFHRNKWRVVFEPTYQYFKADKYNNHIKLKFIEFPFGLRHNFFLNKDYNLYLNALIVPGLCADLGSEFNFNVDGDIPEIKPRYNTAFGAGLNFTRTSVEIRFYTNRNITYYQHFWPDYKKFAFIFAYTLF